MKDDGIVWLASFPKSGNTWVRLFISAYLMGLEEAPINGPSATVGDTNDYLFRLVSPKAPEKLSFMEVLSLRPAVLMHLLEMYSTLRPMIVKTHWPNVLFSGMPAIPHHMTSKALYVVRDPRDIVPSYAAHFDMSIEESVEKMGTELYSYKAQAGSFMLDLPMLYWSEHVRSWVDGIEPERLLVVRYEDMLSDPKETFGAVARFLFGKVEKPRLLRAIRACEFGRLRRQEDRVGFHERRGGEKFFRSGRAGAWRDVLTEEQAGRIESVHGERMRQFGYLGEEVLLQRA